MSADTLPRDAAEALLGAETVVPHTDADGLAAGAIALRARGEGAAAAVLLERGQTPFGREASLGEGMPALLDWGVRELARPALVVDHHVPEAVRFPRGSVVVSSFGETPEVPTAALMRRIVPDAPAWLCAVGAVGDLGDGAFALPECAGAADGARKSAIRKLVPLVNAPRRLRHGPVRTALELLVEHEDPKAALRDPRTATLARARERWRVEFERVVRTPPQMLGTGAALLRFASEAQVHPLVATAWSRRLAPRVVLAANDGYLREGWVNFAVRGGPAGADLRNLLRETLPEGQAHEFAHGHPQATGGSLPTAEFEMLAERLGAG